LPLLSILVDQLHVLEGEHRSVLALGAPAYEANVASALTLIGLSVAPTRTVLSSLQILRAQAARIRALTVASETRTHELEQARQAALLLIEDLRNALEGVTPSVGAQLARAYRAPAYPVRSGARAQPG
jgi:hypothetical protein